MVRIVSLLAFLLLSVMASAQVSENRTVGDFSKLKVASGIELTFAQGPAGPIKVEADDNEKMQDLITKVSGNTLEVYIDSKAYSNRNKKDKKRYNHKVMKVWVSSPYVNEFKASSSSSLTFKNGIDVKEATIDVSSSASVYGNVKAENIYIETSSSSKIESTVTAKKLAVKSSSSSDAILAGEAENVDIRTSSSSDVNAKKLTCKTATIESSSSSGASINVTEALYAKASSSASISYSGNPAKVESEKSSSGSVSKK